MPAAEDKKNERVSTRVEPPIKERFRRVCEYEGRPESSLVRPKLRELYRELEDHPAVQEQKEVAKAS